MVSCSSPEKRAGKTGETMPDHAKNTGTLPALQPEKVKPSSKEDTDKLPSGIIATWKTSSLMYYIRSKDDAGTHALGYANDGSINEREIPSAGNHAKVRRFFVVSDAFYVLWSDNILERVPVSSGDVTRRQQIYDALPVHDAVVLVEQEGRDLFCERNGKRIPVSLTGKVSITSVADDRIIFVSDGSETEVIDALVPRSLYLYPAGGVYAAVDQGNLRVTAYDISQPGERIDDSRMIFFMIYVDGVEAGRTPAGPASLPLSYTLRVEPDAYHIVRLERWELDRGKQRYERTNNINQPEPVSLLVPLNRVVTVDCRYNGRAYNITTDSLR